MKEAVGVAVWQQSNKLKEEAKAKNQEFLNQVDSTMKEIIKEQVKAQVSMIMPQIEKYVTGSLGAKVFVRSTNQPQRSYANRYNALVEAYNSDKDIITSYGDVVTLKRGRDNQDKDDDPSAGSDRGTTRRKSSKDAEPSKGSKSKESKSSSSSKGNQSQPKSLGKSTQADEQELEAADTEMQRDHGNESGHVDDQLDNEAAPKHDWFLTSDKPPTPDHDWNKSKSIDSRSPQKWISTIVKARQPPRTYLEEIVVRRDDNVLYKFKEGDFPRLNLYRIMVKVIDKLLFERRLMRNLEKFVCRRNYGNDLSQKRRDLPRVIPLDSVVILRYEKKSKSKNKGKVPTEIELVLEQNQQGTSYEVSVSAEGVEELKRKIKIKGEKKEALLTLRQKPVKMEILFEPTSNKLMHQSVKVKELQDKRILKAFKLTYQEKYEHVCPKSQDHKLERWQDDVMRLCLVGDLKKLKITFKSSLNFQAKA
ncbi:hypothetical protein Tco_0717472 [Tanacetum coccineum]